MGNGDINQAWDTFWERERRKGTKAARTDAGRGMPESWNRIERQRERVWKDFARTLPKGARILDLGTGDGHVMAHLLRARRDLKLLGIDRAGALPDPPRGAKVRGGVMMEDLPLPDGRFAAVTSQFAFEYGDLPSAAVEVARVLKPGGMAALMTHRLDGPIVAHNRKRRAQIAWALEDQQLLKAARGSLGLRSAGIAALPRQVIEAPEKGAALHGPASAAWEIAEAIRQTLHHGRQDSPANVKAILTEIEAQAENELGRIASLEAAATAAGDGAPIITAMADAGLELVEDRQLLDGISAAPFADFRTFRKA
ncbi:class I SAM-dependent methyltransferase [Aurantiacibacter zhengii]|uniref:Class I SAM-dependent methyltransferase n=1 Tax=Aurantiacibacter zhengii TaxID=2307003 RepID=A0A418NWT4_9SPHN|nr:class I SAM-dependent methyltransferase [Aurantiacibacter zhengii]RIV89048.1 class I SAM-dependent methyltransferase [Aurantiacibacter zhengii]